LKQQAEAGDIILLFGDEPEALTHPYLARAWAKQGADLRVPAPGQARKRALLGVLDFAAGRLIVNTSATKRSCDFIALLGQLDTAYGPCPAHGSSPWAGGPRPQRPVVLVLDNGPIHTSKASWAALAARAWLTVEWLPKYAPELNDIERSPASAGAGFGATSSATFWLTRPSPIPIISIAPFTKRLPI
jgi:hypothetical protein